MGEGDESEEERRGEERGIRVSRYIPGPALRRSRAGDTRERSPLIRTRPSVQRRCNRGVD
jgi:hypothetical protein